MKTDKVIRKWMDKIIMGACVFIFGFMVILGTYQIVTRYVFNAPSTFSEELLTYSFTWLSLLAGTYVFGKRDHMRMAFIADKLTGRPKQILDIVIEVLIFIFAFLTMVWGGWSIMQLSMQQKTASLGISMGYIYSILPVCGVAICVYCILNIYDLAKGEKLKFENGYEEKGDIA